MDPLSPQRLLGDRLARELVEAACRLASGQGLAVAVAVVDASGQLKAFVAMDQSPWVASTLCQRKAKTALLGLDSAALAEALADQPALMSGFAAVEGLALIGGGVPIRMDGQLVGAIGVGGGSPEQDADIARQALESVKTG